MSESIMRLQHLIIEAEAQQNYNLAKNLRAQLRRLNKRAKKNFGERAQKRAKLKWDD